METKQFIEDALAGGFDSEVLREHLAQINDMGFITIHNVGWLFLVPDIWQAVGKTRVWGYGNQRLNWKNNWLAFIQYLADGKTIEEALAAIK